MTTVYAEIEQMFERDGPFDPWTTTGTGCHLGCRERRGPLGEAHAVEVTLKPPFGGCLMLLVTVVTLGTYPLLRRLGERHFIARMDDYGFETRAGKRVDWTQVTRIEHVVGKVNGVQMSDEYVVRSTQGRSSLPLWRSTDRTAALDYLIQRAPQDAWVTE
jgi:hypothetical protein